MTIFNGNNAISDTIVGSAADDIIYGYDSASGSLGNAADNDFLIGGAGNDLIFSGNGNDTMLGGDGADTLNGGDGDDFINTGGNTFGGIDSVSGGLGNDTILTSGAVFAGELFISGDGGNDYIDLSGADAIFSHHVNGGDDSDTIIGSAGADILNGGRGADSISAGNGNDAVSSSDGEGSDTLDGGGGSDFVVISRRCSLSALSADFSNPAILQILGDGTTVVNFEIVTFIGGFGSDTIVSSNSLAGLTENIVFGGGGDDILTAAANGALLEGEAGNDRLIGGVGADGLVGGSGADTLDAGAGNDYLYIDHLDTVLGGAGYDAAFIEDATGANLNVGAAQLEYVYAYTGNDTLNAASSATGVALIGEAGADSITGSAFNDYVYFDALDTIDAGAGVDALFYYQGTGQTLANLNLNVATTHAEYVLGGGGNDVLSNSGSSIAVTLLGGAANDTLTGGLGNDYLYGDSGSGNLGGADVFVVTNNAQTDVVLDFANGADRLNVHNTGLTTFAQVQAAASAFGPASTLFDFGGGNKTVLYNFALGSLDASDIIF